MAKQRKNKIDPFAMTANVAAAIEDFRDIEKIVHEDFKGEIRNYRIGMDMAHAYAMNALKETAAKRKGR